MLLCLCWLSAHQWLYTKLEGHSLLQFCCWTLYPACLCAVAASFCDNVCPASTGLSGMLFGGAGLSAAASYKLALVLLKKNKKKQRRSRCVSGSVNTCSWLICDATPNSNLSSLCAATYPVRIQTGPHINANECCCSTWGQQRLSARNGDSCCSHWQKQLIHTVKY